MKRHVRNWKLQLAKEEFENTQEPMTLWMQDNRNHHFATLQINTVIKNIEKLEV